MPKYVVDPDSQYKKGSVDGKRVSVGKPEVFTKDQVERLEEVGVTLVEYKDSDKPTASTTGTNN